MANGPRILVWNNGDTEKKVRRHADCYVKDRVVVFAEDNHLKPQAELFELWDNWESIEGAFLEEGNC